MPTLKGTTGLLGEANKQLDRIVKFWESFQSTLENLKGQVGSSGIQEKKLQNVEGFNSYIAEGGNVSFCFLSVFEDLFTNCNSVDKYIMYVPRTGILEV